MMGMARGLLGGLSEELVAAAAGGSVHGARRYIKRLRSLLLLLRTSIGEAAYRSATRELKAAADALAGQRRAEALVEAAGRLGGNPPAPAALQRLAESHRDEQEAASNADAELERARQHIAAVGESLSRWKTPKWTSRLIALAFAETYDGARRKLSSAIKEGDNESLHEARKFVIHHLHHLELLRAFLADDPSGRIVELERFRGVLGDLNDLAELTHLAKAANHLPPKYSRITLKPRRKGLLRDARKAWKPLFGRKPKVFVKGIGATWQDQPDRILDHDEST